MFNLYSEYESPGLSKCRKIPTLCKTRQEIDRNRHKLSFPDLRSRYQMGTPRPDPRSPHQENPTNHPETAERTNLTALRRERIRVAPFFLGDTLDTAAASPKKHGVFRWNDGKGKAGDGELIIAADRTDGVPTNRNRTPSCGRQQAQLGGGLFRWDLT